MVLWHSEPTTAKRGRKRWIGLSAVGVAHHHEARTNDTQPGYAGTESALMLVSHKIRAEIHTSAGTNSGSGSQVWVVRRGVGYRAAWASGAEFTITNSPTNTQTARQRNGNCSPHKFKVFAAVPCQYPTHKGHGSAPKMPWKGQSLTAIIPSFNF